MMEQVTAFGGGTAPDIRAAFFDIDGTLTSFVTHAVPESTVRALHGLKRNGIRIFICTGRAPSNMAVVLDTIPVDFDGIVGLNGQYCFDGHGFLEKAPLDPGDVATIIAWLDRHPHVAANFCEEDYSYFHLITEPMRASWRDLGKTAPAVNVDDPHARTLRHETFQISPYITTLEEAELIGMCRNVTGARWHPDFVDLIPADGGKPVGIGRFLRHYGWTREQIIAFGDGGNDIGMLRYAGIGVAMGNADDAVKAAADYVTDDVDHDGILHALRHFGILPAESPRG